MRAPLFLISFALSSAACSGTADDSGQGAASQGESGAAAEGAGDAAVPAEDYAEERKPSVMFSNIPGRPRLLPRQDWSRCSGTGHRA